MCWDCRSTLGLAVQEQGDLGPWPGMLPAMPGATSCPPADVPRQDLCSSTDRRMEEVGSDSGVLKAARRLPISPNNPSGPW